MIGLARSAIFWWWILSSVATNTGVMTGRAWSAVLATIRRPG